MEPKTGQCPLGQVAGQGGEFLQHIHRITHWARIAARQIRMLKSRRSQIHRNKCDGRGQKAWTPATQPGQSPQDEQTPARHIGEKKRREKQVATGIERGDHGQEFDPAVAQYHK